MLLPYIIELDDETIEMNRLANIEVPRQSWHEYFIIQAYLVSRRSLDAQTKVGCVIVDNKNNIISSGYNSFVRNIDDRALANIRPLKYDYMIHSEQNAILSAARRGVSLNKSSCYLTVKPCITCLQYLYQSGIRKIYYANIFHPVMCKDEKFKFDYLYHLMSHDLEINIIESENLTKTIEELARTEAKSV